MKRFTPKEVNIIYIAAYLISIMLIAASKVFESEGFILAAVVLLFGAIIFRLIFYRCPHCGAYLDRSHGKYCPHCGKAVSENEH